MGSKNGEPKGIWGVPVPGNGTAPYETDTAPRGTVLHQQVTAPYPKERYYSFSESISLQQTHPLYLRRTQPHLPNIICSCYQDQEESWYWRGGTTTYHEVVRPHHEVVRPHITTFSTGQTWSSGKTSTPLAGGKHNTHTAETMVTKDHPTKGRREVKNVKDFSRCFHVQLSWFMFAYLTFWFMWRYLPSWFMSSNLFVYAHLSCHLHSLRLYYLQIHIWPSYHMNYVRLSYLLTCVCFILPSDLCPVIIPSVIVAR